MQMPAIKTGGKVAPRTTRKVCLESADRFEDCPVYSRDTFVCGCRDRRSGLDRGIRVDDRHVRRRSRQISPTGEIIIQLGAVQ